MDEKEKYEKKQAFEHDLINRRLTWLLTSQTILFAALVLVFSKEVKEEVEVDEFRQSIFDTISYLGIFISSSILMG